MGVMWSRSGSYEFDNNGDRAPGALAYFFVGGTSTPFAVYEDAAEGTAHTHPVEADGNGRWPAVFIPFGTYKLVITTAGSTTLFTADEIPNPEPTDTSASVDPNAIFQTGDMIFVGKNGTRTGFVRCNGRGIGSATSGGTERANADCSSLFEFVWNNYANGQCAVSGGRGGSAAADFAANKTIALPDHRSSSLMGFDDMGNSAAGLAGSAPVVSGSAILAGSLIGANTHTILAAHLPVHSHAITAQATGAGTAHTHGLGTASAASGGGGTFTTGTESHALQPHYNTAASKSSTHTAGGADSNWNGADTDATGPNITAHTHDVAVTAHTHTLTGTLANESTHTHSLTGTTDSIGSGTAHNILQRSTPVTVLMKL